MMALEGTVIKDSLRRRLAELTPVLMATAVILGMIPQNLRLSGIQGFHIGVTFFFINLALQSGLCVSDRLSEI